MKSKMKDFDVYSFGYGVCAGVLILGISVFVLALLIF